MVNTSAADREPTEREECRGHDFSQTKRRYRSLVLTTFTEILGLQIPYQIEPILYIYIVVEMTCTTTIIFK